MSTPVAAKSVSIAVILDVSDVPSKRLSQVCASKNSSSASWMLL